MKTAQEIIDALPEGFDRDRYHRMLDRAAGKRVKRNYIPARWITYHFVCRSCGSGDVGTFDKFLDPKQQHLMCQDCNVENFDPRAYYNYQPSYLDDVPF